MHPQSIVLIISGVLGCVACGARFAALPALSLRGAVVAEENGVQVVVAEAPVRPCECPDVVVLRVTIQNRTDRMLNIRYKDFALGSRSGERLEVLPPFDLALKEPMPIPDNYPYAWSGFQLAPHLVNYYRGFWNTTVKVDHDVAYYDEHQPRLVAITSVTDAMRRHALPEGILEPDGHITGVLYFVNPRSYELSIMTASFADAQSGRRVVALDVPLAADADGAAAVSERPGARSATGGSK
jgi:hypothetical protein